jgi:hypothetical protein
MSIRRQTLEEWFLSYQLKSLHKTHFHLPFSLDVDITNIENAYQGRPKGPPYTAIVVKGVGLLAEHYPFVNRMLFNTFYGTRVVDFPYVNVNMPIIQSENGNTHLSATVVPDANKQTVAQIQSHLAQALKKNFTETRIGPLIVGRKNTFFRRFVLRVLHFAIYNFPKFYLKKRGGGISVSSMLNHQDPEFDFRPIAFGPTALTFCMTTVKHTDDGRSILKIGVGWDHRCGGGNEIAEALKGLSTILAAKEPALLEHFL